MEKSGVILEVVGFQDFINQLNEANRAVQDFNRQSGGGGGGAGGASAATARAASAASEQFGGSLNSVLASFLGGGLQGGLQKVLGGAVMGQVGGQLGNMMGSSLASSIAGALGMALAGPAGAVVGGSIGVLFDQMAAKAEQGIARIKAVVLNGAQALKQWGMEATMSASRYEQMINVAEMMGKQQGYSNKTVNEWITNIRRQGIEAGVAAELVSDLARNDIDMANAIDLAKVAQDAAIMSNSNSTDTLSRLKWGVMTLNTVVLRTAGLTIQADEAYARYAKTINKTASSLTVQERQQAMVNEIMRQGEKIQGAYNLSMESGNKIAGSMPRVYNDIAIAIGENFVPAYDKIMQMWYSLTTTFSLALQEGGKLRPMFEFLGQVVTAVATAVKNLVTSLIEFNEKGKPTGEGPLIEWLAKMVSNIEQITIDIITWGSKLVEQFALGLVQGIDIFLIPAMNSIAEILMWLMPSSPPPIAPFIDVWGAKTMEQYLKGFTEADYSILDEVQSSLKEALALQFQGGKTQEEKLENEKQQTALYMKLSQQLAGVLSTGKGYNQFLKDVDEATGEYGKQLIGIIKLQFQLKKAMDDANKAMQGYQKAQEKENAAYSSLNKLATEYRNLQVSGAGKDVLEQKRAEIKASREALLLAEQERIAAGEKAVAAQQAVDPIKQQLSLQQRLNKTMTSMWQQMLTLLKELPAAMAKAVKAGGAKGGGGLPLTPKKIPAPEDLTQRINRARYGLLSPMEEFQQKIKLATAGAADALEEVKNRLFEIAKEWEKISTTASTLWENFKKGFEDAISTTIGDERWESFKETVSTLFTPENIEKWALKLGEILGFLTPIILVFGILSTIIGGIFIAIFTTNPLLVAMIGFLGTIIGFTYLVGLAVTAIWEGIKSAVAFAIQWIAVKWTELRTTIETCWLLVSVLIKTLMEEIKTFVEEKITAIKEAWESFKEKVRELGDKIRLAWDNVKKFLKELLEGKTLLGDWKLAIDGIITKVETIVNKIKDWIRALKDLAIALLNSPTIGQSPPPWLISLRQIDEQLEKMYAKSLPAFEGSLKTLVQPIKDTSMIGRQMAANNRSIDRSSHVTIDVNANYANTQSPVEIRDDIDALLAMAMR